MPSLNFVLAPPRFTKIPDELTLVTDGDALLTCEVTGSPPPSLFWLKNGNKVIPSETTKVTDYTGGTSLKLVNPDSKDGGIFQCFAENQLGNIQTIAAVIIHRSSEYRMLCKVKIIQIRFSAQHKTIFISGLLN